MFKINIKAIKLDEITVTFHPINPKRPIMRITDVEDAQKSIMRIARKLADAGELVLAGQGDDYV